MQASIPADFETNPTTAAEIQEVLGQIYDVIDKVGQQLEKTFQDQEDKFLDEYRKQMYSAQKNLREYTKTHSQAELTKKIEEKEKALRTHREKALSHTTDSSDKLKALKTNAIKLKQTLNELEDETNFLDEQLVLSEEKNRRLGDEAKYLKLEILKYQPDFQFWEEDFSNRNYQEVESKNLGTNRMNKNASLNNNIFNSLDGGKMPKMPTSSNVNRKKFSTKEGTYKVSSRSENIDDREVERLNKQYEKEVRNNQIMTGVIDDPSFQRGRFEEIFENCIRRALEKNNERSIDRSSTASTRLPYLSASVDGLQIPEGDVPQMEENPLSESVNISELRLNQTDKKIMIEEFLTTKDIKDYLYAKFVEESAKKTGPCLF